MITHCPYCKTELERSFNGINYFCESCVPKDEFGSGFRLFEIYNGKLSRAFVNFENFTYYLYFLDDILYIRTWWKDDYEEYTLHIAPESFDLDHTLYDRCVKVVKSVVTLQVFS